jgi:hypothetical protein
MFVYNLVRNGFAVELNMKTCAQSLAGKTGDQQMEQL